MTDDLVAFLRARLDEDEHAARDAHYEGQHWISEEEEVYRWPDDEAVHSADRKRDAAHIVRWQPARVLAEVEAKRRMIRRVFGYEAKIDGEWGDCCSAESIAKGRCKYTPVDEIEALRILALPYATHSDYRPEWAPMTEESQ